MDLLLLQRVATARSSPRLGLSSGGHRDSLSEMDLSSRSSSRRTINAAGSSSSGGGSSGNLLAQDEGLTSCPPGKRARRPSHAGMDLLLSHLPSPSSHFYSSGEHEGGEDEDDAYGGQEEYDDAVMDDGDARGYAGGGRRLKRLRQSRVEQAFTTEPVSQKGRHSAVAAAAAAAAAEAAAAAAAATPYVSRSGRFSKILAAVHSVPKVRKFTLLLSLLPLRFLGLISTLPSSFPRSHNPPPLRRLQGKKAWTQEEDDALNGLVDSIGISNWATIALLMGQHCPSSSRTGKQCRERWTNHLQPNISKEVLSVCIYKCKCLMYICMYVCMYG